MGTLQFIMFKIAIATLALAALAAAISLDDVPALSVKNGGVFTAREARTLFKLFQAEYGMIDAAEQGDRFAIFQQNLVEISKLNKLHNPSATFGVGPFAALSKAEFKSRYLMKNPGPAPVVDASRVAVPTATSLGDDESVGSGASFSWLSASPPVVSPIKNQEQCGSCWAFSATENIESIWAIAGNPLPILAPQQIVDCDTKMDGCNGGWPVNAIQYIIKNGQESEASYPYTAVNGQCKYKQSEVVAQPHGWHWATSDKNETLMALNLKSFGPLSVAVDAESWQLYKFGVIRHCGTSIDHGVGVVAYANVGGGTIIEPAYWLVRNSWGTTWGEDGYIKLEYGKNTCAVAEFPASASMSASASSSGNSGNSGRSTYVPQTSSSGGSSGSGSGSGRA